MLTTFTVEQLTQKYLCHRLGVSESPLGLDFFSFSCRLVALEWGSVRCSSTQPLFLPLSREYEHLQSRIPLSYRLEAAKF